MLYDIALILGAYFIVSLIFKALPLIPPKIERTDKDWADPNDARAGLIASRVLLAIVATIVIVWNIVSIHSAAKAAINVLNSNPFNY